MSGRLRRRAAGLLPAAAAPANDGKIAPLDRLDRQKRQATSANLAAAAAALATDGACARGDGHSASMAPSIDDHQSISPFCVGPKRDVGIFEEQRRELLRQQQGRRFFPFVRSLVRPFAAPRVLKFILLHNVVKCAKQSTTREGCCWGPKCRPIKWHQTSKVVPPKLSTTAPYLPPAYPLWRWTGFPVQEAGGREDILLLWRCHFRCLSSAFSFLPAEGSDCKVLSRQKGQSHHSSLEPSWPARPQLSQSNVCNLCNVCVCERERERERESISRLRKRRSFVGS